MRKTSDSPGGPPHPPRDLERWNEMRGPWVGFSGSLQVRPWAWGTQPCSCMKAGPASWATCPPSWFPPGATGLGACGSVAQARGGAWGVRCLTDGWLWCWGPCPGLSASCLCWPKLPLTLLGCGCLSLRSPRITWRGGVLGSAPCSGWLLPPQCRDFPISSCRLSPGRHLRSKDRGREFVLVESLPGSGAHPL